jgi:hypothetical protein
MVAIYIVKRGSVVPISFVEKGTAYQLTSTTPSLFKLLLLLIFYDTFYYSSYLKYKL